MKKFLAVLALVISTQAVAGNKVLCPLVGKMAEAVAESAQEMSPDEMQISIEEIYTASLRDAKTTEDVRRAGTVFVLHSRVLAFVVEDRLDVYTARRAIIQKCHAGLFDSE